VLLTAPLLPGEYYSEWARVQLRCKEYVDATMDLAESTSRGLPTLASGIVFPQDEIDQPWRGLLVQAHFLPRALSFAERGVQREKGNPDPAYYLGETRHFQAVYATDPAAQKELFAAAAAAYERAYRLFPWDVRILLRLGRACDNLGQTAAAEDYLGKAIAADPKLSNVYAYYGFHLWRQRKVTRAEAYYVKALTLRNNEIAVAGLREIRQLQALANDPQHVDLYGDPLENYDKDGPTVEDERRGVKLDD
jgi:tetratricopeptide (TPR) repeat protein